MHIGLDQNIAKLYDVHGNELSGVVALHKLTTLTNSQIKAMPAASPIAVLGYPGKLLVVHRAILVLHSTAAYTNVAAVTDVALSYNDQVNASVYGATNFFANNVDTAMILPARILYSSAAMSTLIGASLVLQATNSDNSPFTGGAAGNSLDVHTWFSVI